MATRLTEREELAARILVHKAVVALLDHAAALRKLELLLNRGQPIPGLDELVEQTANMSGEGIPEHEYWPVLDKIETMLTERS